QGVHRRLFVAAQRFDPSALQIGEELRAFLEREVVGGNMIRFQSRRLDDIAHHVGEGLSGNRKYQIQIETRKTRSMRQPRGFAGLFRAVDSPEKSEDRFVE